MLQIVPVGNKVKRALFANNFFAENRYFQIPYEVSSALLTSIARLKYIANCTMA